MAWLASAHDSCLASHVLHPSGRSPAAGWFAACAPGAAAGAAPGAHAWQLAEQLYACQRYALAFQLALAPEVGEDELGSLGPEWPKPATLLALQSDALEVAEQAGSGRLAGHPAARRLAATLAATLGLSAALQDSMGARRGGDHAQRVHLGQAQLEAVLRGGGGCK